MRAIVKNISISNLMTLIVGASGATGKLLVEQLLNKG